MLNTRLMSPYRMSEATPLFFKHATKGKKGGVNLNSVKGYQSHRSPITLGKRADFFALSSSYDLNSHVIISPSVG